MERDNEGEKGKGVGGIRGNDNPRRDSVSSVGSSVVVWRATGEKRGRIGGGR